MELEFIGSSRPTIGVEIELQIIDRETLDLTPKSNVLINICKSRGLKRVKAEVHQSMIEIDTEISINAKQCKDFLIARIQHLSAIAEELNLKLAISGTHPFQRWVERLITPKHRYQNLYQKYQWLVRRMNVYGLHVHVGVKSGEEAISISNSLAQYLPHLIALSANSPFWQGLDTGMHSSRINIMESFPYAGNPLQFNNWKEFEHYYSTLHQVGAITSLKDLYWHMRPNLQYGTLEFRICDAMSNVNETIALVALIQSLVVYASEHMALDPKKRKWAKELQWIAPQNQWVAARDGLEGIIITDINGKKEKISDSIYQLLETLEPTAKNLECFEELQEIKGIIKNGNGAQRQRKIFAETHSLTEVVSNTIREFQTHATPVTAP